MPQKRKLTLDEEAFVKQAELGSFSVGFTDDGTPYAMGARATGNLFDSDLNVKEGHDPDGGSTYWLEETT